MSSMTEAPTVYAKAPIVEAVIDIQVQMSEDAERRLLTFVERVGAQFPQKSPIQLVAMNVGADGSHSMERKPVGWRLVNEANDRILQVRRQGFTFSHMPPYSHWGVFRSEAEPLWRLFVDTCGPEQISRIAVRYINRLRLPPGAVDLKDFLTIYPQVPDACEPIEGLLMQLQGRHPDVDATCRSVITVASEPASDAAYQPIVLDLDLYVETELKPDDARCWSMLDQLRIKKNQMFEASITEKMREIFR